MRLISVVIPAVKFDEHLRVSLQSLINQKNITLEVKLVFNQSIPRLDLKKWPSWIHFENSKLGVNCARNKGLRNSTSDLVFFLDSDCELVEPLHLSKWFDFMMENPNVAGVGGGYQVSPTANYSTQAYNYLQMDWLRQQIIGEDFRSCALIGGNMLLRKSKIQDCEFDEKIIFGGSEKEFFVRLSSANLSFYLDLKSNVRHLSELSAKELLIKAKAQALGEKYIQSKKLKQVRDLTKICILKPYCDPAWYPAIESYKKVFARHSGSRRKKVFNIKKPLHQFIEHLNLSQSKND